MKRVEREKKYQFILKNPDFLHLADWLQRSTHSNKPDFSKANPKAKSQELTLFEELTFELRSLTAEFVQNTNLKL